MSYKPFTTHQQRRELLLKVPSGKARLLLRAVLADLNRAEVLLLSTPEVKKTLERIEAEKAAEAIKTPCQHQRLDVHASSGVCRCVDCGQSVNYPKLDTPCKHERKGSVPVMVNPEMGSVEYCLDCHRVLL